jgi:hypothetical protein
MPDEVVGTMRQGDGFPKLGGYHHVDDSVQAVVSFYGTSDPTLGIKRDGDTSYLVFGCDGVKSGRNCEAHSPMRY